MGLMMLGAGQGSDLELQADGWDAKEALEALAALVEAGFHEQD
jgi:phosphocarrier protein